MSLKAVVDSLDSIADPLRDYYVERNGKFELKVEIPGVDGVKSYTDFQKLNEALRKERTEHKTTKEKYAVLADRDPQEVISLLDKIPELEAAAKGKVDDEKMNELVEARLKTRISPLERDKAQLTQQLNELNQRLEEFKQKERVRSIHDKVREAGGQLKVLNEAMEDALMLAERVFDVDENGNVIAKDGVGCTPGITPSDWFKEIQEKRPHWWGPSMGGGAGGNRGNGSLANNPWSHDNWNLTEQGKIFRENPTRAEQLAKSAGTSIGGMRPEVKK